jgi:hypothetical protein
MAVILLSSKPHRQECLCYFARRDDFEPPANRFLTVAALFVCEGAKKLQTDYVCGKTALCYTNSVDTSTDERFPPTTTIPLSVT